jgi:hypothetical protein
MSNITRFPQVMRMAKIGGSSESVQPDLVHQPQRHSERGAGSLAFFGGNDFRHADQVRTFSARS